MNNRPNMLLIYSDQHRYDSLGCHGNPQVRTPHMDRLAREGADFLYAFTPSPICVPARCSLLCGQYPTAHGVVHNFDGETFKPLDPGLPTHPRAVAGAGYTSIHFGRWHVDPNLDGHAFGFDEFTPDWRYAKYRDRRGFGAQPREARYMGQSDDVTPPRESSVFWHARQVIRRMEWQLENSNNPFFIHWHMIEPHLPCRPLKEFADLYDPAGIEPWPGWQDDLTSKPWIQRQMPVTWQIEEMTWSDWAPVVARYFAVITELDAAIGEVLAAIDRLGIGGNTLTVYTSDHGDMCGSHHMIDKHNIMYDDVMRVPLLMRWPGVIPDGVRPEGFVSNSVDLAATFCAAVGTDIPSSFQGQNLIPLCTGKEAGRENIYASFSGNQFGSFSQRMLRDRRWKYIWNACAEDELYDLDADPGECRSLIAVPEAQAELPRLRKLLAGWMDATGDKLFNSFTRSQFHDNRILGPGEGGFSAGQQRQ